MENAAINQTPDSSPALRSGPAAQQQLTKAEGVGHFQQDVVEDGALRIVVMIAGRQEEEGVFERLVRGLRIGYQCDGIGYARSSRSVLVDPVMPFAQMRSRSWSISSRLGSYFTAMAIRVPSVHSAK